MLSALRCLLAVIAAAALTSCGGVSSLSVADVAQMSDTDLCYANYVAPVGFIPTELDQRKRDKKRPLNCTDHHQAILDKLAKEDEDSFLPVTIPDGFLGQSDCKGVQLGRSFMPLVSKKESASGWTSVTDHRFHQYVHNRSAGTKYVLFETAVQESNRNRTKFLKLPPRSDRLVRFGSFGITVSRVSIAGCREF